MDRAGDVLHLAHTVIKEGKIQLIADLLLHITGNRNSARFSDFLQAGGYIDPVAEDIVAVDDDIAQVDSDPVLDPLIAWYIVIAAGDPRLQIQGPFNSIHDRGIPPAGRHP